MINRILPLLSLLALSGCFSEKPAFNKVFADRVENPWLNDFKLDSEKQNGSLRIYQFKNKSVEMTVTSITMDPVVAPRYFADKEAVVDGLFAEQTSPYPGQLTKTVTCAPEYRPIKNNVDQKEFKAVYFELYANDRKLYGICAPEQIFYKSYYALIHCPKSGLILDLRLYYPAKDKSTAPSGWSDGFKCV